MTPDIHRPIKSFDIFTAWWRFSSNNMGYFRDLNGSGESSGQNDIEEVNDGQLEVIMTDQSGDHWISNPVWTGSIQFEQLIIVPNKN